MNLVRYYARLAALWLLALGIVIGFTAAASMCGGPP